MGAPVDPCLTRAHGDELPRGGHGLSSRAKETEGAQTDQGEEGVGPWVPESYDPGDRGNFLY